MPNGQLLPAYEYFYVKNKDRFTVATFFTSFWHIFTLNKPKMTLFGRLPAPIVSLVLLYEGSIVKSYLICILRRLNVRSYQALLTRDFKFNSLNYYCLSHLAQLVHTEMYTVSRFSGHESTRVYRKCLKVWLPLIHHFKMRNALHNIAVQVIYGKPPGHPMFRRRTDACLVWLNHAKVKILGRPTNNPRSLRALWPRQNF